MAVQCCVHKPILSWRTMKDPYTRSGMIQTYCIEITCFTLRWGCDRGRAFRPGCFFLSYCKLHVKPMWTQWAASNLVSKHIQYIESSALIHIDSLRIADPSGTARHLNPSCWPLGTIVFTMKIADQKSHLQPENRGKSNAHLRTHLSTGPFLGKLRSSNVAKFAIPAISWVVGSGSQHPDGTHQPSLCDELL